MAKIHPSILAANHGQLASDVQKLEKAGVHSFHIDIMDGNFVPNFGIGTETLRGVKQAISTPIDIHLMVQNPGQHIPLFAQFEPDVMVFHPEVDHHAPRTLQQIKDFGIKAGIAISPGMALETVKELLPLCQHVLVMTVNPGFGGQQFLEFTLEKLAQMGVLSKKYGFELNVDGNITPERVAQLLPLGVEHFVMGTALFKDSYLEVLESVENIRNHFSPSTT